MSSKSQEKLGRRSFLKTGAAGVSAVAAAGTAGVAIERVLHTGTEKVQVRRAMHGPEDPDQYHEELLGLSEGMQLGEYEIERVAMRDGAVRVEAKGKGQRFRVDILHRSRSPRALGETADYSLYLCNQGTGNARTDETCGVGVLTLAAYLEQTRPEAPADLLDYKARRNAFPVREKGRFLF